MNLRGKRKEASLAHRDRKKLTRKGRISSHLQINEHVVIAYFALVRIGNNEREGLEGQVSRRHGRHGVLSLPLRSGQWQVVQNGIIVPGK